MSCPTITVIKSTECIGNSLNTINNNYQALKTGVCDNQSQINALRTLLYDLSSNMNTTYKYAEYAWIGASSTSLQALTNNTDNVCILNSEVTDRDSIGQFLNSDTTSNVVRLQSGMYNWNAESILTTQNLSYVIGSFGLWNNTTGSWISRTNFSQDSSQWFSVPVKSSGSFEITTQTDVQVRVQPTGTGSTWIGNRPLYYNGSGYPQLPFTASSNEQRTKLQLWKIS